MGGIAARAICEHYPNGGTKDVWQRKEGHSFELHRRRWQTTSTKLRYRTIARPRGARTLKATRIHWALRTIDMK